MHVQVTWTEPTESEVREIVRESTPWGVKCTFEDCRISTGRRVMPIRNSDDAFVHELEL